MSERVRVRLLAILTAMPEQLLDPEFERPLLSVSM